MALVICGEEGCGIPVRAKGLCNKHYQRSHHPRARGPVCRCGGVMEEVHSMESGDVMFRFRRCIRCGQNQPTVETFLSPKTLTTGGTRMLGAYFERMQKRMDTPARNTPVAAGRGGRTTAGPSASSPATPSTGSSATSPSGTWSGSEV